MGSASFGLQFGGQSQEVLLFIMLRSRPGSVLQNVKLGGDIVAAGPAGAGAGAKPTNLRDDIYSFINEGAFVSKRSRGGNSSAAIKK